MVKTNAMRMLDAEGFDYKAVEYEVDENHISGTHAAMAVGMPEEQVFKTLVARGDKSGIVVFCIPAASELDLKKAATITKNKKVEMIAVKELLGLTGYIRGGCSPIGMKKKYSTWIDETALLFDEISISAGVRGCQIIMNPEKLIAFVEAIESDITKD